MSNNHTRDATLSFLIGAAAGSLTALLLAPMSGRDLRTRIGEEAEAQRDAARDKLQDLSERASNGVRELSNRATETYSRSRDRASEFVGHGRDAASVRKDAVADAFRAGLEAYEKALRTS